MEPIADAGCACLRGERAGQFSPARDRQVQCGMPLGEPRQRVHGDAVTLDRIQVAERDRQAIPGTERQLTSHGAGISRRGEAHAVGHHVDARSRHEEIAADVRGELLRDGDDARAPRDGRAQRQTPLEPSRVIAAAVHGGDERDAGMPRCPRAIDGHGEFVAVRQVDPVPFERQRDRPRTRRR
jgi:hypothetical protein